MPTSARPANRLINETSPYLLQHAHNPVDWWPWCEEAFAKARREDKPVFLSIGYSTCHWCHVMERESFEDAEAAAAINDGFVPVKVDREERPDIDSVYMDVCQAFTGSGGWPLTILMTPEQQPFFAGTYIPKQARHRSVGLMTLLDKVQEMWAGDREELLRSGGQVVKDLASRRRRSNADPETLIGAGADAFKRTFDHRYGGFGPPPKFPSPHNLLFLLRQYEIANDPDLLRMAEQTLTHMYKGGLFDHIGFGFSRYSTDRFWLAPHFEKMLYDNALQTLAYLEAYRLTGNELYKTVAVRTLTYVSRELTDGQGGFYCAQDADSDGVEGKYYVFTPEEIIGVLGPVEGARFNRRFDITERGNFEGKSIPNLRGSDETENTDEWLPAVYEYRKGRTKLHLDDKILTSWNALMITAFARAHKVLGEEKYLRTAQRADSFLSEHLCDGGRVFTSYRAGRRSPDGFLDDHAFYVFALLELYETAYDRDYLDRAAHICDRTIDEFFDKEGQGFALYGRTSEQLILRPKETYDGAIPSGNSVMSYNLVKLARLTKNTTWEDLARRQMDFMAAHAAAYPAGHGFWLTAAQTWLHHTRFIVCALRDPGEKKAIIKDLPPHAHVTFIEGGDGAYHLVNGRSTFYPCDGDRCLPPVHTLDGVM